MINKEKPLTLEILTKAHEMFKDIKKLPSAIVMQEKLASKLKEILEPKKIIFGCPIIVIPEEYIPKQNKLKKFLFALVGKKDSGILDSNNIYLVYSED